VGQKSFLAPEYGEKIREARREAQQERALLYWCETIEAADLIEFWNKLRGTKLDRVE